MSRLVIQDLRGGIPLPADLAPFCPTSPMQTSLLHPVRALSLAERTRTATPARPGGVEGSDATRLREWWERTYFQGQPALFSRRLRADDLSTRTGCIRCPNRRRSCSRASC